MRGWSSTGSGKTGAWPAASEWQAVARRQRRKQVGLASAVCCPSLAGCAQHQADQQTSHPSPPTAGTQDWPCSPKQRRTLESPVDTREQQPLSSLAAHAALPAAVRPIVPVGALPLLHTLKPALHRKLVFDCFALGTKLQDKVHSRSGIHRPIFRLHQTETAAAATTIEDVYFLQQSSTRLLTSYRRLPLIRHWPWTASAALFLRLDGLGSSPRTPPCPAEDCTSATTPIFNYPASELSWVACFF